jgi:hypothetical protein
MPTWLRIVAWTVACIAGFGASIAVVSTLRDGPNQKSEAEEIDPAAVDASLERCGAEDNEIVAGGSVTNHSSETSDYVLAVVAPLSGDRERRLVRYVRGLGPGEQRDWEAKAAGELDEELECRFEPSRMASQTTNGWCAHFDADPTVRESAEDLEFGRDTIALCEVDGSVDVGRS